MDITDRQPLKTAKPSEISKLAACFAGWQIKSHIFYEKSSKLDFLNMKQF